jgi:hypothetical protein
MIEGPGIESRRRRARSMEGKRLNRRRMVGLDQLANGIHAKFKRDDVRKFKQKEGAYAWHQAINLMLRSADRSVTNTSRALKLL